MITQSATISVSIDQSSTKKLVIVQEDWSTYLGLITKYESVSYISSILYSRSYSSRIRCGIEDNKLACFIFVYPIEQDLKFEMHTSYGEISGGEFVFEEKEEYLNFNLSKTAEFDFPPINILNYEWQGPCLDGVGNVVPVDIKEISGTGVELTEKVYASILVRYTTVCYKYTLVAERRAEAIDSHWSAVVYGVYEGGEDFLEIEMPPGVEVFENDPSATCGASSGKVTFDEREFYPPSEGRKNRNTVIDYCSQNTISDEIVPA